MNRIAKRSGITLLIALLLVAGFGFFLWEYIGQAQDWVLFPGSPHVYNGGNIGCGVVVDSQEHILLDMQEDHRYSDNALLRMSTLHWLGDREGSISAPALSAYAGKISGFDYLNGVYSYGNADSVIRLTLSGSVQAAALEAMGDHKGTVAVYNYKTGQLICAVTTPTYDPDNVPDIAGDTTGAYEGVYLNRFTQASYVPGSIFKVVTLAAALESIPDIRAQQFECQGSYAIGPDIISCESVHGAQDLETAFRNSCNCAFAQIAQQLGSETLAEYVDKFGVTESIRFDGITTASGNCQVGEAMGADVAWAAIGQHKDLINPCAFLSFMGAIARDGQGTQPYLVESITQGLEKNYTAKTETNDRILSDQTAKTMQQYLRGNVEQKYGDSYFPGLTVCAKTGTGEVGGGKKPNAMLAGFVTDPQYPLAFVVCVENGGYGASVCLPIASQVLSACRETMGE